MRCWKTLVLQVLLPVVWLSSAGAQQTELFLPAAARANGKLGTVWVSDVRIFNPDAVNSVTVSLTYLPSDQDNSSAPSTEIVVPPREAVALPDIVAATFGATGAGGIRMTADAPFLVNSRTFNSGGGNGTFGQYIPGLPAAAALEQGLLLGLVNLPGQSGFRSNPGFLNVGLSSVTVMVKVFDASTATFLGQGEIALPPLSFHQINDVFDFIGLASTQVANATVEFHASGPVLAYASVIDNLSGDPVFVLALADTGTPATADNPPDGAITLPAGDVTIAAGEAVEFAGAAVDPDGDNVTVLWNFGDGSTSTQLNPGSHTYADPGTYTVTFAATDEHGLTDPTPDTRTITVTATAQATFTRVQNEIFTPSCALSGCHTGPNPAQGQNLSAGQAYSNIVGVPSHEVPSLNRIEPGSPSLSYMWLKITGNPSIVGSQMPLGGSLTQAQRDLLQAWIEAGALNN